MHIALLGRQPALSLAELERVFGNVNRFSQTTAIVEAADKKLDVERLGGTQKAGKVVLEIPSTDWRKVSSKLVDYYLAAFSGREGKITLGISAYEFSVSPREVQKVGIILKSQLKKQNVSIRLIPNAESALSTATSHHNKLGLSDNKVELMIVQGRSKTLVAESTGAQNITALSARDQGRPRRDAFVGMLPPKLAQIMINLATQDAAQSSPQSILDPFCGTGVVLQEALLLGNNAIGTDLSDKMVAYSQDNLKWLTEKHRLGQKWSVTQGDAMDTKWQGPVDAVVAETYLGQPFSAPPSAKKLEEVRGNCNHIISSFLKNLHPQLKPGTQLCIAVPAWRDKEGSFTHLPLTRQLENLGYETLQLRSVRTNELLYFRPDQVVARELLVITRK